MHSCFVKWSDDHSELLSSNFEGIFGQSFSLHLVEHKLVEEFLHGEYCDLPVVRTALKELLTECTVVMERQMPDFLTGKFSSDTETSILGNLPLTNLMGESAFG